MATFSDSIRMRLISYDKPCMAAFLEQHQRMNTHLEVKKIEAGRWNVSSPVELAIKVTLLSLNGVVMGPLIALASLVEGVLRALSGGTQFLLSFIPFEGNEDLRKRGSAIADSSITNVFIFTMSFVNTFVIPASAIWSAIQYSRDTSCCEASDRLVEADKSGVRSQDS